MAESENKWSKAAGEDHRVDFERTSTAPKKAAAVALWLAAIVLQLAGALVSSGKVELQPLTGLPAVVMIAVAVICAALSFVGARKWREAARADGVRGQGGAEVAMSCLAFAPMCLFFLTAKNATGRTKALACASAAVMIAAIVLVWLV